MTNTQEYSKARSRFLKPRGGCKFGQFHNRKGSFVNGLRRRMFAGAESKLSRYTSKCRQTTRESVLSVGVRTRQTVQFVIEYFLSPMVAYLIVQ